MMALEALLPSEVARLVYGYLQKERCTETAQLFLNECADLYECRSVLAVGKSFTTRVNGYALKDILESFCAVNSVVQEKINRLKNLDDLKHCYELVDKIQFFLEEDYRNQRDIAKSNASTQITPIDSIELLEKSQNKCSCHSNDKHRFDKEVQTEIFSIPEQSSVEATLLKNLPGYISNSENGKLRTEKSKIFRIYEDNKKIEYHNINLYETQNKDINHKSCKLYADSASQTSRIDRCEMFHKNVMTDNLETKLTDCNGMEVQTCEIRSPDSGIPSSIELLGDITLELLNRTEIQERIANNINRILESKQSLYFSNKFTESTKEELSKSFVSKFNKTVQTAFNKTEDDVLDLINEIIQPMNEAISAEDEADMEIDNSLDEFQEDMDLDIGETITELKNTEETLLVANGQTDILKDQNLSNKIYETMNIENKPVQEKQDLIHSVESTVDQVVVEKEIVRKDSEVVSNYCQNNVEKIESNCLISIESQGLQHKSVPTSDHFFTHNNTITSTPLKTYTAVEGFETCDWFSTEALLTPDIDYNKESLFKTNPYTASKTVVPVTTLISPITSKDTSEIAEKVNVTNCLTANALKNQTLNTPDITFSQKSHFQNCKSPKFPKSTSSSKEIEVQKSPEIKSNMPNSNSLQKCNGTTSDSSCLSNEKLFGSESIMLYGMENNVTTLPTLVNIPEIEVEDSITLTGTGLSPFIKINKAVKNTETEKCDTITTEDTSNTDHNKPIVSKSSQESTENIQTLNINISEVITKNTPNVLKENRLKNGRLSLSTPKKPSSHVRALNFETPAPRSQSESKANEQVTGLSPESILKELKNACKLSLFQSPEISNAEIIEKNDFSSNNEGGNENLKVEKITQITDPNVVKTESIKKKSWDEDLRVMCGQPSEKEQSKKYKKKKKSKDNEKNKDKSHSKTSNKDKISSKKKSKTSYEKTPKKLKQNDKKTPKKSKKSSKLDSTNNDKNQSPNNIIHDNIKVERSTSLAASNISEKTVSSKNSEDMPMILNGLDEALTVEESSKTELCKSTNDVILSNSVLEALLSNNINEDEIIGTTDVMKLAAEEMDNLSKLGQNNSVCNIVINTNRDIVEKMHQDEELMTAAFGGVSKNTSSEKNVEDLENKNVKQPQNANNDGDSKQLDNQLADPELNITPPFSNSSLTSTGSSQKAEVIYDKVSKIESGRLVQKKYARLQTLDTKIASKSAIHNFTKEVVTLHKDEDTSSLIIPPTPRVLSPGNSCSFLTMPTYKLGDESQMRSIRCFVTTPVECPLTPEIVLTPPKIQDENTEEALKNVQSADSSSYFQSTFPTFETLNKSEITQFEVIKENLKDTNKKIQSIKQTSSNNGAKPLDEIEIVPRHQQLPGSSSNCSSVSCSCCSSSLTSAAENYVNNNNDVENNCQNIDNGPDAPTNNIPINIEEPKVSIVSSPAKVFFIHKTDQELAETIKETPVKDENDCLEMGIVDTPNISKPAEFPTNLNTKITQTMSIKNQAQMKNGQLTERPKPTTNNVQRILPRIIMKPCSQLAKALTSNKNRQSHDAQDKNADSKLLFQEIKFNNSEEDVIQAVNSITVNSNFQFDKSLEKSTESITISPVNKANYLDNSQNNIELAEAIQSISNEINSPVYIPLKKCNVFGTEDLSTSIQTNSSNIELSVSSDYSQDFLTIKSEQKEIDYSKNWINHDATNKEFNYIFNDETFQKHRRKKVNDEELVGTFRVNKGTELQNFTLRPSSFECIYNLPPARKKREPIVKSKRVYVKEDSLESSSTASTVFSITSNSQQDEDTCSIKRKRSTDFTQETVNNKRVKNLNFDQF